MKKLREIEIAAKKSVLDLFSGMYRSTFKGQGIELDDIREYVYGDDPRSISWNKTAQLGRPFVKTFTEERDLTVLVMVDISHSTDFSSTLITKRERMAEVAAIIAFSAIANHDKVGLLLFSSEVEHYIPPKRGMKHGVRIIRDIMETKPKKQGTSIAEALRFLTSVTSKRCIAFLISDFEDTAYEQDFTITAKKNDLVAIKITDPQEEEPFPLGLVRMKELEGKEREEIIDFNNDAVGAFIKKREEANIFFHTLIGKSGADSIELTTKGDIHVPLRAFFARRKKRL